MSKKISHLRIVPTVDPDKTKDIDLDSYREWAAYWEKETPRRIAAAIELLEKSGYVVNKRGDKAA